MGAESLPVAALLLAALLLVAEAPGGRTAALQCSIPYCAQCTARTPPTCRKCMPGAGARRNATGLYCAACSPGKFSPGGTAACKPCAAGTSSGPAAASCTNIDACASFPCNNGKFGGEATCTDQAPPAPNSNAGRSCTCSPGFTYKNEAAGCTNINACAGFPCTKGAGQATCKDLPPPSPNSAAGRNCTCGTGFSYVDDSSGCQSIGVETYCCSGSCPNPVPKPPPFERLPKPTRAASAFKSPADDTEAAIIERMIQAPSYINGMPRRLVVSPAVSNNSSAGFAQPAGVCRAGARVAVELPGSPQAQGQAKLFFYVYVDPFPADCGWGHGCSTAEGCLFSACSGNTLSSGLILTAAHCTCGLEDFVRQNLIDQLVQDGYDINADPCALKTIRIAQTPGLACYNFPQNEPFGDVRNCDASLAVRFNGYSWHRTFKCNPEGKELGATIHDQAVLFLAQPKVLPEAAYYKYNYLDNYPAATPVNVENWSYIGICGEALKDYPSAAGTCTSQADRDLVSCGLSHTGPTQLPGKTLASQQLPGGVWPSPLAINVPITSFPGNSGSCMLNSPDQCCLGVSSFGTAICSPDCNSNHYSPIMKAAPLSALWAARQVSL